jgi:hypothetical protein
MLSQWLAVHLRRVEEARQARTNEEEEPGRYAFHQGLQAATLARWQRIRQIQGPT